MPSIFSRARTSSTKNLKSNPNSPLDQNPRVASPFGNGSANEFGVVRVSSRGPPPLPAKDKRSQTFSNARRTTYASVTDLGEEAEVEDGFLPTSLNVSGEPSVSPEREYGYLAHESQVVLAIEEVERLVDVVSEQLVQRGLSTPFLFSNTALDLESLSVKRLITTFLRSPDFREEAKFSGPHALGAFLRWGLARPIRILSGQETRGFISWDVYLHWREIEHSNNFSKSEFSSFVGLLNPQLRPLTLSLLTLLARLLAHSTSSGLTPAVLASLFGPLMFGVSVTSFYASYMAYLRSAHAAEHILLAYVRQQVAQALPSAPPPRRLVSWVQGYPAMLAPLDSFERPRLGARTRRVVSVRRNVRLYSEDLVRTCAGWARGPEGASLRASKEWTRIAPEKRNGERMEARYSDAYRKKLDLPPGCHPVASLAQAAGTSVSPLSTPALSTSSTSSGRSSVFDDPAEEAKFRSLTDMRWGEFAAIGFGDGAAAPSALQFDLTEGARSQRSAKRSTLSWNDFSEAGFSRGDQSLSETLQFGHSLAQSVQQLPSQEKELHRKLKKSVQKLPSFGWDTAPVIDGREEMVEEGFLDVFCDLLYGGGWMDRTETTFRDCNWAVVEFKSLPTSRAEIPPSAPSLSLSTDSGSQPDPRIGTALILFEEFVPAEYRTSLINQGTKPTMRKRLGISGLLGSKKSKTWKQASTLNGKPYTIGNVPRGSNAREAEFERLISGNTSRTKVLSLNSSATVGPNAGVGIQERKSSISSIREGLSPLTPSTVASPTVSQPPAPSKPPADAPTAARAFTSSSLRKPRFRLGRENKSFIPSEYETVDFDTRLASYSDDELNGRNSADTKPGPAGAKTPTKEKRMSKDDAWVDILVSGRNRMTSQEAEMRPRLKTNASGGSRGLAVGSGIMGGHSDPELASLEVQKALAGVRPMSGNFEDEPEPYVPGGALVPETPRDSIAETDVTERTDYTERIDSNGDHFENEELDGDEVSEVLKNLPKKRMGYFDLHPERRPPSQKGSLDEPRSSNVSGIEDESIQDKSLYSDEQPQPSNVDASWIENHRQPDGDIEVPAFIDPSPRKPTREPPSVPQSVGNKTANLIEMYRERERQAKATTTPQAVTKPAAAVAPSRIPSRTSSLPSSPGPAETLPAKSTPLAVPQTEDVNPSPDSSSVADDEDEDELEPTPPFMVGETGRASPGRYVHGAPLHNVLEEEEEE